MILQRISSRRARMSKNFTTTPSMFTTGWSSAPRLHRGGQSPRCTGAVFQPSGLQCSVRVHPKSHRRCDVRPGTHVGSEERAGWPRFTLRDGVLPVCGRTECPHARAECPRARHALARVFCFFSLFLSTSLSLSRFLFSLSVLCCVSHVPTLAFRVLYMSMCVVHVFSLVLLFQGVLDRLLL